MTRRLWSIFILTAVAAAQQNCYVAAGENYRAPSSVVPCLNGDGHSSCCLQGDTCLAGGACYNFASGNVYQYGCSDSSYEDESCPRKCESDPNRSPWVALEYCADVDNVDDTWICHSPESCGCDWNVSSWDMLKLTARGCKAMGSDARVALYAPPTLTPYLRLPSTNYGSTAYWNMTVTDGTTTWDSTPANGYTPSSIGPWTTYSDVPTTIVLVEAGVTPSPSTLPAPSAVSTGPTSGPTVTSVSSTPASSAGASTSSGATSIPPSSTPTASPSSTSSSLSTGAKAGIGVGVAGGVCGIAALALAAWMMRRRKQKAARQPGASPQMQQPYSQGPPTPGVPPYNPHEKPEWQGGYPQGGPPQGPYYNHSQMSPGYHEQSYREVPGAWSEAPKPQIPSPPMELPAERGLFEIGSEGSAVSRLPSPTPAYAEVDTAAIPRQR